MSVFSAKNLCKRYGKKEVVHNISLHLGKNEVVGILGPNGAGKTTTFNMLVGVVHPTVGNVYLNHIDITKLPLHERARKGISYLPQESSIFKKLTVEENLQIILEQTNLNRKAQKERVTELLTMFRIERLAKQAATYLSGGERRRLEIARALILNPEFILLDEPFAGIDPIAVMDIQQIIAELCEMGIGIFISDHNVRETLAICHRAYIVFAGNIMLEGTPEQIVQDTNTRQVYLGDNFSL